MGIHPLVVTTQQVELWDRYKEKVLSKRNPPVIPSTTEAGPATSGEKETTSG